VETRFFAVRSRRASTDQFDVVARDQSIAGGNELQCTQMVMRCQRQLVEVVRTLRTSGKLPERLEIAGKRRATSIPIIAITTKSSTSVKPCKGREKRLCFSGVNWFLRPRTWRFLECPLIIIGASALTCTRHAHGVRVLWVAAARSCFKNFPASGRKQIAAYFVALPRPHTVAIESVGFYRWAVGDARNRS